MAEAHAAEEAGAPFPGQKGVEQREPAGDESGQRQREAEDRCDEDRHAPGAEPRGRGRCEIGRRRQDAGGQDHALFSGRRDERGHRNQAAAVQQRQDGGGEHRKGVARAEHSGEEDDDRAVGQRDFAEKAAAGGDDGGTFRLAPQRGSRFGRSGQGRGDRLRLAVDCKPVHDRAPE